MNDKYYFFYGGPFSNWCSSKFVYNNIEYNCVEQFMMASKARLFGDLETEQKILNTPHPRDQKKLGRQVKNFNTDIWNAVARDIVFLGNLHKYISHADLRTELLKTNGLLVEASPYDCIWGIGIGLDNPDRLDESKWRGTNWLGLILTDIRALLIKSFTLQQK